MTCFNSFFYLVLYKTSSRLLPLHPFTYLFAFYSTHCSRSIVDTEFNSCLAFPIDKDYLLIKKYTLLYECLLFINDSLLQLTLYFTRKSSFKWCITKFNCRNLLVRWNDFVQFHNVFFDI